MFTAEITDIFVDGPEFFEPDADIEDALESRDYISDRRERDINWMRELIGQFSTDEEAGQFIEYLSKIGVDTRTKVNALSDRGFAELLKRCLEA